MRIRTVVLLSLLPILGIPSSVSPQAIIDAVRGGDQAEVLRLLDADPGVVAATDPRQCTPLHFAANSGDVGIVELLLDAGADLEAQDEDGDGPLAWATHAGRLPVMELLLDRGANPDLQNRDGHAPLHLAVMGGRGDAMDLLIRRGADVNLPNSYGRTPLLLVARETGNALSARTLLAAGADADALDRFGSNSLNLAAWRGFESVVDVLLDHGVEVAARGPGVEAVTEFAAQKGLERLFRRLVEVGADLGVRTENGGSLLHAAAEGGSREIVETLMGRGLGTEERDRYGWTPLHYAAERGREEVSALLLSRGADPNAASIGGHTPLSLTTIYGKDAEARLLEAHGATRETAPVSRRQGPWLGEETPGAEPEVFALDLVSSSRFEHGTVTFSPDGTEAFWESSFMPNETGYSHGRILTSRMENGVWTLPAYASFSTAFEASDDVPFFSPDGQRLYFDSRRPQPGVDQGGGERIWFVERSASGWGPPQLIRGGPNELGIHWQFSVAANGNIYVGSGSPGGLGRGDVWVSRFVDGAYLPPENLGAAINTEGGEDSPFIAPDESYLIFTAMDRPDGLGGTDLYISFKSPQGEWTPPLNMGDRVNTTGNDICPMVSGDGRFLFWNSRPQGNSDNYWMDAGFIQGLKAQALEGPRGLGPGRRETVGPWSPPRLKTIEWG